MSDTTGKILIKRLDTNTQVLLNPGQWSETHTAEMSSLPVLYTEQPIVKYKYSTSSFSLNGVQLYNGGASVVADYEWLKATTKPKSDYTIPQLSLTWNDIKLEPIHITGLQVKRTLMKGGFLTLAELDITLVIAPAVPEAKTAPTTTSDNKTATGTKLTDREQADYAVKVTAKLKSDARLATTYKWKTTSKVLVDASGNVTVDGKKAGDLSTYGLVITTNVGVQSKVIPLTTKPTGATKSV